MLKNQFEHAELIIAGGESDLSKSVVEKIVRDFELEESVEFTGHVDEMRKRDLLSSAWVFALPSRDENFGISVAEALAAGVPVVISPGVSHAAKVSQYGAGLVVPRDVDLLASALASVLSAEAKIYDGYSIAGRLLVSECYSWTNTAKLLVEKIEAHHQKY
jgi:glycosyltransferase involved in cell wall biosynthesis